MPNITKVRRGRLDIGVRWFTSVQIFLLKPENRIHHHTFNHNLGQMDYANVREEWETTDLHTELKLCYLFLLIFCHMCDVLMVLINRNNLS